MTILNVGMCPTLATMVAAAFIVARTTEHMNRAHGSVPHSVRCPITGLGVAALLLLLAPWWFGESYGWHDAVFVSAAAWYVWRDRRGSNCMAGNGA